MVAIGPSNAEEPPVSGPIAVADSAADLAPTASVPWNPPRPVPTHESWEHVLNAPLTLLSLPFRALGALTEAGLLRVQEDHLVPRVHHQLAVGARYGVIVAVGGIEDGSGLGGAVRYAPSQARGWLRGGLAGTFRHYHRGQVELGPPWLAAAYVYDWRPEEAFFGIGADAVETDASNYAMQAERIGLRLALHTGSRWRRELDAWVGERQSVLRSGRASNRPSVEQTFPQLTAGALDVQQIHRTAGLRVALDTRAGRPHWSRGSRLEAQAEYFGSGDGLVFEGNHDSPGFRRFTLAGQAGWSFMRDPRTLRLIARLVDVQPLDPSRTPLLYDLSRLGGGIGLGAFEPGRFYDLDLLVVKLGYIFPLVEYAEIELATEIGSVSADVWNATRIDQLARTYSVVVRPRSHRAPIGSIGFSWGPEGARLRASLGGVE